MDHRALLDRLGSDVELAGRLGVHFTTVWRWRRFGIPWPHWIEVTHLARESGVKVNVEQLARAALKHRKYLAGVL